MTKRIMPSRPGAYREHEIQQIHLPKGAIIRAKGVNIELETAAAAYLVNASAVKVTTYKQKIRSDLSLSLSFIKKL